MNNNESQNMSELSGKVAHMERFYKHESVSGEIPPHADAPASDDTMVRYEPKELKKILRIMGFVFFVFVIGAIGGIVTDRWIIPFIVSKPGFSQFAWLQRIKENTTIVETTKEIKISEDLAMVDAISKTKSSVVKVIVSYNLEQKPVSKPKKPLLTEIYTERINGVIITGDGLVLARPSGFIPPERIKDKVLKSTSYKVILADNREFIISDPNNVHVYAVQTSAGDPLAKTVILKIDASNLPVIPFGDMSNVLLGSRIAILGQGTSVGSVAKIEGVSVENGNNIAGSWKLIYFDNEIANKYFYAGAPLINIKGEMIGLNIISNEGNMTNSFLSIDDIKTFIDSVMGRR